MIFPTIHLGGTSGDALFADNMNAFSAIREALESLRKAAPNARDYYVQGPDAFSSAQREHIARLEALSAVAADLALLVGNIVEQQDQRESRKR